MSYLSDTFGVPLGKQFKQPDLQVTPESLMAPQQPFGAQPFGNLSAIGVSSPSTPPYGAAGQSQQSVPPFAPTSTGSQFQPDVSSAPSVPPALAKLGVGTPVAPTANLTESYNTPGAFPAPAQLLDMPTRDQGKESKRLANMAGVGGLLGLLLGGGAGALQGASSAVQGGSQALDFAAQNEAQKVQVENQKRLQEAANERQSWIDQMTVEDQRVQRQIAKDQADLKRLAEQNDRDIAMGRDETTRYNNMAERKLKTLQMINGYFDTAGEPLRNSDGVPVALIALQGWNAEARSAGFPQLEISENEISASPTAKVGKDIASVSASLARAENLIEDTNYKKDIRDTRIAIEQGKLKGQELDNKLKDIYVKYAPRDKESLIAYRSAMATLFPTRIELMRSQVEKTTAEAKVAKNKAEGVGPVILSDVEKKEQESIRKALTPEGWNEIEAKMRKAAGLIDFPLDPSTPMGKAQAEKKSKLEADIKRTKDGLISRAKKAGFTDLGEVGSGEFTLPYTTRKVPVPTESSYLGKKPEGFGAFNPAWTPSQIEEFNKLKLGSSNIIRTVTNPVIPKSGLNWSVTSYGYAGDNFKGDDDTPRGVGALPKDPTLKPGDVGVSDDVLAQLQSMGYKLGDRISVKFAKDGKMWEGSFRIADRTSDKLKNRFDLFLPASEKGYIPYDGAKVVSVGNRTAPSSLKVEEVKTPTKTPPKKPLAKPAGRKVESGKPVGKMSSASLEAERKRLSNPTNIFGNMQ